MTQMRKATSLLRHYLTIVGNVRKAISRPEGRCYVDLAVALRKLRVFCADQRLCFHRVVEREVASDIALDEEVLHQLLIVGEDEQIICKRKRLGSYTYGQLEALWAYLQQGMTFDDAEFLANDFSLESDAGEKVATKVHGGRFRSARKAHFPMRLPYSQGEGYSSVVFS